MDKDQAAENINVIKEVMNRASNLGASAAPQMIMWGLIVAVGYGAAPLMKDKTGFFWMIASPFGMLISAFIGIRQDKKIGIVESWIGKRLGIFWFSWLVINSVIFASLIKPSAPQFIENGLYWALAASLGLIVTGLLTQIEVLIGGLALAIISTVSALYIPGIFYPVVGISTGMILILLGFYVMRKSK